MDKIGGLGLYNFIKTMIDNYITSIGLTVLVIGEYKGDFVLINNNLKLPIDLLSGTLKKSLKHGDKLRLLRNQGCGEYYILEIIDKEIAFNEDVKRIEKRIK